MFGKLAIRNVKRQIGNYLIYFITVSITVALMFAVNNVIYNKELQEFAKSMSELRSGLIGISLFVSLIVAFVLGYATSFMLKLRKREFGTYLTLGMTRHNILIIFIIETMVMCAAALGLGIVLGLFTYQGLMMIISKLLELEFVFASYSLQGLVLTIVLVCSVFILASLTSAFYLKRVSIYHLIHGGQKVSKKVKHPVLWVIVTLVSFAGIIASCFAFEYSVEQTSFHQSNGYDMFSSITALGVFLIVFHIGLARSAVNLMLKSKRICSRGTNTFTLRQLSGQLGASSVMAGALAFLIAFAVIGANVSLVQKVSEQVSLDRSYPFDISCAFNKEEEPPISLEKGKDIINQYTKIESSIAFSMYTTGDSYLHSFTQWSGEGYSGLYDMFLRESDYIRLMKALGKEPIDLNGGFIINDAVGYVSGSDFSSAELNLNGKTYAFNGVQDFPVFSRAFFFIVIADEAVVGMSEQMKCAAINTADEKYDAEGLRAALTYTIETDDGIHFEQSNFSIKEYVRIQRSSNTAIFVVGALYIAVVFVFMAMAMLALKVLSGLSEDKRRYDILYRLGTGQQEQNKTLFRQIFSFFFLPFALPMLLSIPVALICGQIMKLSGFTDQIGVVYTNCLGIAAVLTIIYILYFMVTYLIAKRNVVRTRI